MTEPFTETVIVPLEFHEGRHLPGLSGFVRWSTPPCPRRPLEFALMVRNPWDVKVSVKLSHTEYVTLVSMRMFDALHPLAWMSVANPQYALGCPLFFDVRSDVPAEKMRIEGAVVFRWNA